MDVNICRICHEGETPEEKLYHPCKCIGSIGYVHQDCLAEWFESSGRAKKCDICGYVYTQSMAFEPSVPEKPRIGDVLKAVPKKAPSVFLWTYYFIRAYISLLLLGVMSGVLGQSVDLPHFGFKYSGSIPAKSYVPEIDVFLTPYFGILAPLMTNGLVLTTTTLAFLLLLLTMVTTIISLRVYNSEMDRIKLGQRPLSLSRNYQELRKVAWKPLYERAELIEDFMLEYPNKHILPNPNVVTDSQAEMSQVLAYLKAELPSEPLALDRNILLDADVDTDVKLTDEDAEEELGDNDFVNDTIWPTLYTVLTAKFTTTFLSLMGILSGLFVLLHVVYTGPAMLFNGLFQYKLVGPRVTEFLGIQNINNVFQGKPLYWRALATLSVWWDLHFGIQYPLAFLLPYIKTAIFFRDVLSQLLLITFTVKFTLVILMEFFWMPFLCGFVTQMLVSTEFVNLQTIAQFAMSHPFYFFAFDWGLGLMFVSEVVNVTYVLRRSFRPGAISFLPALGSADVAKLVLSTPSWILLKNIGRSSLEHAGLFIALASFVKAGLRYIPSIVYKPVTWLAPQAGNLPPLLTTWVPISSFFRLWPAVCLYALFGKRKMFKTGGDRATIFGLVSLCWRDRVWVSFAAWLAKKYDLGNFLLGTERELTFKETMALKNNDISEGCFVRAPALSIFMPMRPKDSYIKVDQTNRRLDGLEKNRRGDLYPYCIVWRPKHFVRRSILVFLNIVLLMGFIVLTFTVPSVLIACLFQAFVPLSSLELLVYGFFMWVFMVFLYLVYFPPTFLKLSRRFPTEPVFTLPSLRESWEETAMFVGIVLSLAANTHTLDPLLPVGPLGGPETNKSLLLLTLTAVGCRFVSVLAECTPWFFLELYTISLLFHPVDLTSLLPPLTPMLMILAGITLLSKRWRDGARYVVKLFTYKRKMTIANYEGGTQSSSVVE